MQVVVAAVLGKRCGVLYTVKKNNNSRPQNYKTPHTATKPGRVGTSPVDHTGNRERMQFSVVFLKYD